MALPTTDAELAAYYAQTGLRPPKGSEPRTGTTTSPALVLPGVLQEERRQSPFWPYRSRLEQRYATLLHQWHDSGMIVQWRYEAMRLKLAPRSTLTVDFWLTMAPGVGDGRPQLHETKGYAREDAVIKLKQAAVLYPEFRVFLVTLKEHQWSWQEIPAA